MSKILVLYYSKNQSCANMAKLICRGIESVNNAEAICKTVPPIRAVNTKDFIEVPQQGPPFATIKDLEEIDGLCLGSPSYFGNMPAAMKYFIDQTTSAWFNGTLTGKPAGLFTSSSSIHGGNEAVLLSMMIPLLHHGMIIAGLPYQEPALANTITGGTPYGASHYAGIDSKNPIDENEKNICIALGKRIATLTIQLAK
jgi:NAD(P)H dehydrogenase (quinone)